MKKEKYLVQTSEEEEGKGDREDEEEVNEDEDGEGEGEDTCKEGRERKGRRTNTYLQFNCKSN